MKKEEIVKGGRYRAKVSGRLTTVRVLEIRETVTGFGRTSRDREVYDVLNEATGRRTTFRSAQKFRGPASSDRVKPMVATPAPVPILDPRDPAAMPPERDPADLFRDNQPRTLTREEEG